VERARTAFHRPGLVSGGTVPQGLVVVVLLRSSFPPPSPTEYRAYLEVNGVDECRGDVHIQSWGTLEAQAKGLGEDVSMELSRLTKHGIAQELWYGAGPFAPSDRPDA
jgi:hypothetical protein